MASNDPYADDFQPWSEEFQGPQAPKQNGKPSWYDDNQVQSYYQQYLGRQAGPDELPLHYGAGSLEGVRQSIVNSPEAAAFKSAQVKAPTPTPTPQSYPTINISPYSNPNTDKMMEMLMQQMQADSAAAAADRAQRNQWQAQTRQNIQSQLDEARKPVDMNDPYLASQAQVIDAGNQRTMNQSREALAARAAAGTGGATGAQDAAVENILESLGRSRTQANTGLMAGEYNRRKNEVDHLLDTEAGVMSGDQQAESSQLSRDLSGLLSGLQIQNQQGQQGNNLALQQLLGTGDLDLRRLGLSNQNSQFYDNLTYNMGHDSAMLDYLYNQLAGAA